MSKKVDNWMPLLVDKYLGDTTHLTTELHGAYLLLLMAMWKRDGMLPNDDTQLLPITRLAPAKWKVARGVLMAFFDADEDGGYISQKRLKEELERAKTNNEAKAKAGAKGAAKRWRSDSTANGGANGKDDDREDGEIGSTVIADAKQKVWQTDAPRPLPLPSVVSEAGASAAAAAPAPDPLTPTERTWTIGVAVLGEKGRSFIGKLIATYGEGPTLAAVTEALEEKPVEAKAWLVKACEAKSKNGKGHRNGAEDDEDPKPKWAIEAGFSNRYEAHNERCFEHNAKQFRDGKRIAS